MIVRAKYRCTSIILNEGTDGGSETVKLTAGVGKGNEAWSKWTPNGELSMTITNPQARGLFKPGQHYYLDITEVEESK